MNGRHVLIIVLFAAILPVVALGQAPRPAPLPSCGPAPLLYIRINAPDGVRATFFQGGRVGRDFKTPVQAGLRPGYIYRLQLSRLPHRPGVSLYPTLEVRGTLQLPPGLRVADYPAPVVFSEEDIEKILGGSLLTKVVYLEHPDRALPQASPVNQPLEIETLPGADPIEEARARGRPLLIVQVGERELSDEELARESVPGTILLPGDQSLSPPASRPQLPLFGPAFFDPVLGPRPPEEACLHDGGDSGIPAGFDHERHLQGLEPSDTVAAYSDSVGRRRLVASNRVCLSAPRFLVTRGETTLHGYEAVAGVGGTGGLQGFSDLKSVALSQEKHQDEALGGLNGRERPSGSIGLQALDRVLRVQILQAEQLNLGAANVLGTTGVDRLTVDQRLRLARQMDLARQFDQPFLGPRGTDQVQVGPQVVGRIEGVQVATAEVSTREITFNCNDQPPLPPDQPLVLHKWADKQAAQVGDVVTFYLKYTNLGGRPITEVAVSDSLTGRLEYIPGSARTDRDAVFTTQQNEAGSAVLHWEISGSLLAGQSGVVSFQTRVR